jgi:hypothetical protein
MEVFCPGPRCWLLTRHTRSGALIAVEWLVAGTRDEKSTGRNVGTVSVAHTPVADAKRSLGPA